MQGRLLRQLQAFVGAEQPSFLPGFGLRAQDFQEGVQMLVYDVLMLKVRCQGRPFLILSNALCPFKLGHVCHAV